MINLDETEDGIWDDDRPKVVAENTINYEQDTANKIYDADFGDIL